MLTLLQVAAIITLVHGSATSIIRNPSTEPLAITAELLGPLPALDPIRALVAPAAFTLQPGETQTIKLRLRDVVPVGTVLRLRTCFTPVVTPVAGDATAARAVLLLRTCIVSKVVV